MISADDLLAAKFKAVLYADMARGGWLQVRQCVEHPRLTMVHQAEHRGAPVQRQFFVDDQEVESLEAAARSLNENPSSA